MLKKERHYYILQQLNLHNKILVSDICTDMDVSEDTIRRDLQELADSGQLIKVHGGALSLSFGSASSVERVYALPEKQLIGRKAVSLIKEGMLILLAGGSTVRELIRQLPQDLNLTFVTPSIPIAQDLLGRGVGDIIFIGNIISKNARMAVGAEVIRKLADIHADICFIGTNSIDVPHGITDLDWEVVEVKRAMLAASRKKVVLTIAEKLNTMQRLQACPISDISMLITELDKDSEQLKDYANAGVELI